MRAGSCRSSRCRPDRRARTGGAPFTFQRVRADARASADRRERRGVLAARSHVARQRRGGVDHHCGCLADYFHVLGIALAAGRMFTADEDVAAARRGRRQQRVRGVDPWHRHADRRASRDRRRDVRGHRPAAADQRGHVRREPRCTRRLAFIAATSRCPASTIVQAVARLRPDSTPAHARAEVHAVMRTIVDELPATLSGWSAGAVSIREGLFGDSRPALTVLFLAVCLLTAIACANLANVTLAEMSSRRDEITLRTALGASRAELVRLIAMEHVLLSLAGGASGLLVARVALPAILALDADAAASLGDVTIDWRVQAGAFALALVVSVISGVLPALNATRGDLARGLAHVEQTGDVVETAGTHSRLARVGRDDDRDRPARDWRAAAHRVFQNRSRRAWFRSDARDRRSGPAAGRHLPESRASRDVRAPGRRRDPRRAGRRRGERGLQHVSTGWRVLHDDRDRRAGRRRMASHARCSFVAPAPGISRR